MLFKISHVAWYLKSSIKVLFKVFCVASALDEVSKGGGAVSILGSFHDSAGWSPEGLGLISDWELWSGTWFRDYLRSPFRPDFPVILWSTHWDHQCTNTLIFKHKVWQTFLQWFSPLPHCFPLPEWDAAWMNYGSGFIHSFQVAQKWFLCWNNFVLMAGVLHWHGGGQRNNIAGYGRTLKTSCRLALAANLCFAVSSACEPHPKLGPQRCVRGLWLSAEQM